MREEGKVGQRASHGPRDPKFAIIRRSRHPSVIGTPIGMHRLRLAPWRDHRAGTGGSDARLDRWRERLDDCRSSISGINEAHLNRSVTDPGAQPASRAQLAVHDRPIWGYRTKLKNWEVGISDYCLADGGFCRATLEP